MTQRIEAEIADEMAWLRRLAMALARDREVADDLVQDVWLAALRTRPQFTESPRPWLARVARNLMTSAARRARSRDRWERLTAAPEELPSPEALTVRFEGLRRLGELVTRLEEPHRSTVLLCYLEEVSPTEVARRQGIPAGTVRWRLKQALDSMRAQLDEEHRGDRRAWCAALLGSGATPAPPIVGIPLALKAIALAAAALSVVAIGLAWRALPGKPASVAAGGTGLRRAAVTPARVAPGPKSGGLPAWIGQAGAPERRVSGRVTDGELGLAGARVVLGHQLVSYGALPPAETMTGPDGRFDFGPQLATLYTVAASAPAHGIATMRIDLRNPVVDPSPDDLTLALSPCTDALVGRVLDPSGAPIVGARILASGLLGVESDTAGAYELCLARGKWDARVEAWGRGTILLKGEVVGRVHRDATLVPQATMAGRVLREGGTPVEAAHVRAWSLDPGDRTHFASPQAALADAEGRFQLAGLEPGRWHFAAAAGGLVGTLYGARDVVAGQTAEIDIVLHATSQVAGGVTERGRPVAGARVELVGKSRSDTAVTQADGRFVLDRVESGTFRITVAGFTVLAPRTAVFGAGPPGPLRISVSRGP